MRVLGLGVWGDVRLGLGLDLYILYHNLSYGLGSFTIKLPVISITRPGATGGRLGATPPRYRACPPLGKQNLRNICNPPPLIKLSPPHYIISVIPQKQNSEDRLR